MQCFTCSKTITCSYETWSVLVQHCTEELDGLNYCTWIAPCDITAHRNNTLLSRECKIINRAFAIQQFMKIEIICLPAHAGVFQQALGRVVFCPDHAMEINIREIQTPQMIRPTWGQWLHLLWTWFGICFFCPITEGKLWLCLVQRLPAKAVADEWHWCAFQAELNILNSSSKLLLVPDLPHLFCSRRVCRLYTSLLREQLCSFQNEIQATPLTTVPALSSSIPSTTYKAWQVGLPLSKSIPITCLIIVLFTNLIFCCHGSACGNENVQSVCSKC